MRLAFAAALVFALRPAWAEEALPTRTEIETMSVYSIALAVDRLCPAYKINVPRITEFLNYHGFDVRSIEERYPKMYALISQTAIDTIGGDRFRRCNLYFDELGDFGRFPHLLVHR